MASKETDDKPLTVELVRDMENQILRRCKYLGFKAKFIGASKPVEEKGAPAVPEWYYFEDEDSSQVYIMSKYASIPGGLFPRVQGPHEEELKFWENILIWQSDHPEFFE